MRFFKDKENSMLISCEDVPKFMENLIEISEEEYINILTLMSEEVE